MRKEHSVCRFFPILVFWGVCYLIIHAISIPVYAASAHDSNQVVRAAVSGPTALGPGEPVAQAGQEQNNAEATQDQAGSRESKAWLKNLSIEALALIVLSIILFTFALLWLKNRLTGKNDEAKRPGKQGESSKECELLYWDESGNILPVPADSPLKAVAPGDRDGNVIKSTGLADVYLELDSARIRVIPLLHQGADRVEELVIARRTASDHKEFLKKGAVYLMVPGKRKMISRPREGRPGHARIFYGSQERYYLEDMGSKVGTLLNNQQVKGKGALELQDGDIIQIGGKIGLTITYRETLPGQELPGKPQEK